MPKIVQVKSLFSFFVFMLCCARAFAVEVPQTLAAQYPATERFQLQSGQVVTLPAHLDRTDFTVLAGKARLAVLNQELAAQDLTAVEVAPGFGQIQIWGLHYIAGDAGAAQEVIIAIPAVEKAIRGAPVPAQPRTGYYIWQIWVTSELSLRMGVDIWGDPKQLGMIRYDDSANDIAFDLRANGQNILSATCSSCVHLPTAQMQNDYYTITPYSIRRSWAHGINRGQFTAKPFNAAADTFHVNETCATGQLLNRAGFQPTDWYPAFSVETVIFK